MVKMIGLDLDGTLINPDYIIAAETLSELERLHQSGVKIAIVTGRPYQKILEILGCNRLYPGAGFPDYLIAEERDIYQLHQESYDSWRQWNDSVFRAEESLLAVSREVVDQLEQCCNSPFLINNRYLQSSRGFVELFFADAELAHSTRDYLSQILREREVDDLVVVRNNSILSLRHKAANKGNSLSELASRLKLPKEDILVIGDSENDLPMLTGGFLPATTSNADFEVKTAVTKHGGRIAQGVASQGVGELLRLL